MYNRKQCESTTTIPTFTANKTIFHASATSTKQTTTTEASKGSVHVVVDMQVL